MKRLFGIFLAVVLIGGIWLALQSRGGLPRRSLITAAATGGGLFAIFAGVFNWGWFFDDPKAQPLVRRLGRIGARLFYIGLGMFLTLIGAALILSRYYLGTVRR